MADPSREAITRRTGIIQTVLELIGTAAIFTAAAFVTWQLLVAVAGAFLIVVSYAIGRGWGR